jgi:hypothetical protein
MPTRTTDELLTKKEEIRKIGKEHGARNVRLFGSFAKGAASESSDVDIHPVLAYFLCLRDGSLFHLQSVRLGFLYNEKICD